MRAVVGNLWRENLQVRKYDYGRKYVEALIRGVERHVPDGRLIMLVDDTSRAELDGLEDVDLVSYQGFDVGGWSRFCESWRPDISARALSGGAERYMTVGLDTAFTGDCSWLFDDPRHDPVLLPIDPYHAPLPCDGITMVTDEGAEIVWDAFMRSRETGMRDHLYGNKPSEMALLRALWKEHGWEYLEDPAERVLSYKCHVMPSPGTARQASIVYFHGSPKPGELPANDWVRKEWDR